LGVDISHDMLKVARANLDRREARNCQVRHGDMYQLPLPDASFEATTLHQVLHFADDPLAVLTEARRVLRPCGRLGVVGLDRQEEEWLRTEKRKRRLGFSREEMKAWLSGMGFIQDEPVRLQGRQLNVMIWVARLPPPADEKTRSDRRK